MQVYLNGKLLDADQASLSIEDAGFQHGVGLFETLAAYNGRIFRLTQHLRRLEKSAQELGLARSLDTDGFAKTIDQTLKANALTEARVRLTVTAGPMSMRPVTSRCPPGPGSATIPIPA